MTKKLLLILPLVSLCACAFNRTSEPSRFYAITTPAVNQVRGPSTRTNLGIENVSVPQSVDRPQIVIKQSGSTMLIVSEFDRWIEGLNTALPVAISEDINAYAKNINAKPVRNAADASNSKYLLAVDFVRFETEADGVITLSAWWTVTNNRGDIVAQKKTTLTENTPDEKSGRPDYDAIVATQSKLIARLSYKIADAISELK